MDICNYSKTEINDLDITNTCKNETKLASGKCIFHDEVYAKNPQHGKLIQKEFSKKMSESGGKNLSFIGYILHSFGFIKYKFENCDFSYCEFSGDNWFIDTKFSGNTSFTGAQFTGTTIFTEAEFSGTVTFDEAKFFGRAGFIGTKFLDGAIFLRTCFKDVAFIGTEFLGTTNFHDAKFSGNTSFDKAKFSGNTSFDEAKFSGDDTSFIDTHFCNFVSFKKVKFEKQNTIEFDSDLSMISFLHTDITRVRFGDNTIWGGNKNHTENGTIYDEWNIKTKKDKTTTVENILTTYRQLRENYEYYLKYEEAGNFFVRESEVSRIYKNKKEDHENYIVKKDWNPISFSLSYKYLANYGESYKRPAKILIGLLITGFISFLLSGESEGKELIEILGNAGQRTIHMIIPYFGMHQDAMWLDYLLKIPTIPVFGLLFIALKRKFERKHRH